MSCTELIAELVCIAMRTASTFLSVPPPLSSPSPAFRFLIPAYPHSARSCAPSPRAQYQRFLHTLHPSYLLSCPPSCAVFCLCLFSSLNSARSCVCLPPGQRHHSSTPLVPFSPLTHCPRSHPCCPHSARSCARGQHQDLPFFRRFPHTLPPLAALFCHADSINAFFFPVTPRTNCLAPLPLPFSARASSLV